MKVFLLHRNVDFDPKPELCDAIYEAMRSGRLHALSSVRRDLERQRNRTGLPDPSGSDEDLVGDLELDTLFAAMAAGDEFLFETARRVVLTGLREPDEITYRQQVLADCLAQPEVVGEIYELAIQALVSQREVGGLWSGARPSSILQRAVRLLGMWVPILERLRQIADDRCEGFSSEGFTRFFAMVRAELSDDYLATVRRYLKELEFKHGMIQSAELGEGDKGHRYIVHEPARDRGWMQRLPLIGDRGAEEYSFELHPRDEAGPRYLEEIRGEGINHVADAVAQSADHVQSFFTMLRLELAFYLGCVNLHARLTDKGEPTCFPTPCPEDEGALTAEALYDVSLSLHVEPRVVGNEIDADGRSLVMITGANQGGKSTFLRSLGLAQLMMQCGMYVGAESLRASVSTGVFTHYKREEEATMEAGKLDEELSRMSEIAKRIAPGAILLSNESFASTNEREGSEIARQVVRALLDRGIRVVFVTHMYDLANSFYDAHLDTTLFLRAEREADGQRTFRLLEGEPLPTSFGEDSYRRIFGDEPVVAGEARP